MRRRALYKNKPDIPDTYVFTVSNSSLSFNSSGETKSVTVTSTKNDNNHPWIVVIP